MNDAQRYLTIEQAASYLQVSRWSLYKLVQRRRVPFIPVTVDSEKPILRFDARALDAWMAKKVVAPPRQGHFETEAPANPAAGTTKS